MTASILASFSTNGPSSLFLPSRFAALPRNPLALLTARTASFIARQITNAPRSAFVASNRGIACHTAISMT